jgi:superfamily II helicase
MEHFLGCLESIAVRLNRITVKKITRSSESRFQRVMDFVGDAPGWLARLVRPVANTNNWIHTRSAFLS